MKSKWFVLAAALAVMMGSVPLVLAAPLPGTLYKIDPTGTATVSKGTCITPDGNYVGFSDGASLSGGLWDVTNLSRTIWGGGVLANDVAGIDYRVYAGNTELVAYGDSSGTTVGVAYFFSTDYGASWPVKLRRTGTSHVLPIANGLAGSLNEADGFYSTWAVPNNAWFAIDHGTGAQAVPPYGTKNVTNEARMQGVSGYGLGVGYRKDGAAGANQTYVSQFQTTGSGTLTGNYHVNALRSGANVNLGTLYAISKNSRAATTTPPNSTVDNIAGGMSPSDTKTGNWPFVVRNFSAEDTGTARELPTLNPLAAYATNGVVYGLSADGKYAVGMDYTLGTGEKAALWTYDSFRCLDRDRPDPVGH